MIGRSSMLLVTVAAMLAAAAASRAQVGSVQVNSARDCALCHLEWVDAFKQRGRVLLIAPPAEPVVAAEDTCLGCHDGSVGDSRRVVWLEHSHKTGIVPPATMQVPPQLPLSDGKIACRTCHSAHGPGSATLATIDFIRVRNDESQLCRMCHTDYAGGPQAGTHPVGQTEWLVPDDLLAAGGKAPADRNTIICQSCHRPHGSKQDHLLVLGTQTNALCTTCHSAIKPDQWHADTIRKHSRNVPLVSDAQRQAIRDMGTSTGRNDTLICLSCHKVHHGQAGRYMLADTLANSALCVRCHGEYRDLLGTAHDLTATAPQAVSLTGADITAAGPCSACHASHQVKPPDDPRLSYTGTGTPDDSCIRCHRTGGFAEAKPRTEFRHPTGPETAEAAQALGTNLPLYNARNERADDGFVACASCHDPHASSTRSPGLLRAGPPASDLCVSCHKEPATLAGGLHDYQQAPAEWPDAVKAKADLCGSCHVAHSNDPAKRLWAVAPRSGYAVEDGVCLACHGHLEWSGHGMKPAGPDAPAEPAPQIDDRHGLPLVPTSPGRTTGAIGCKTCHNPHGSPAGPPHILREGRTDDPAAMCLSCHEELQYIGLSLHSREAMQQFLTREDLPRARQVTQCGPCHAVHGEAEIVDVATSQPATAGVSHLPPDVQRCVVCHREGGGASPVKLIDHFPDDLQNVAEPGTPGFMPLANPHGAIGPEGRIACVTCHMPHGRPPGEGFPAIDPKSITENQLRAMMPMVRPYTAPNLCSSCHGYEGVFRYLYFHHPQKRALESENE